MANNDPARDARWVSRPLGARLVRGLALLLPISASTLVVFLVSRSLTPPSGSLGLYLGWWFGLSAVATLALILAGRLSRRLLPLAALLKVSLVFPDATPSRFRTAIASGTVGTLEERLAEAKRSDGEVTTTQAAQRLLALVAALDVHDGLTRGHSERVRAYSQLIGRELGLGEGELEMLNWAALLHDVGKLEISTEILNKTGRPTDAEWEAIRRHPAFGEALVEPLREWLGVWAAAVSDHHERWDGAGYPRRLAGTDISLAGRIVAVADVFDVITSARSYKDASSMAEGRQEIARGAGTQFDPEVVRAFLAVSLGRARLAVGPLSWLADAAVLVRAPLTAAGTLSAAAVVGTSLVPGPATNPTTRGGADLIPARASIAAISSPSARQAPNSTIVRNARSRPLTRAPVKPTIPVARSGVSKVGGAVEAPAPEAAPPVATAAGASAESPGSADETDRASSPAPSTQPKVPVSSPKTPKLPDVQKTVADLTDAVNAATSDIAAALPTLPKLPKPPSLPAVPCGAVAARGAGTPDRWFSPGRSRLPASDAGADRHDRADDGAPPTAPGQPAAEPAQAAVDDALLDTPTRLR